MPAVDVPRAQLLVVVDGVALPLGSLRTGDRGDLELLDHLLRLHLGLARAGARLRLAAVCPDLAALAHAVGVAEVLGLG